MEGAIPNSAGRHAFLADDSVMGHDGYSKVTDSDGGQDPTVLRFQPIFSSVPFSKVASGCRDNGAFEMNESDMADDERPQSARTVDGYSRSRDLMDIDSTFHSVEPFVSKARPLYGVHEDCFAHCLRFLPVRHLCITSRVSRDLRRACNCDSLWAKLCQTEFGAENAAVLVDKYSKLVKEGTAGYWKEVFKLMVGYQIQLVFTGGPRAGDTQLVHVSGPDGCMIGRSRQNNICILQDEMVSRKHAKISRNSYHYMVHDVGSINGTFVNQKPLTKFVDQRLHFGDQVDMGNSVFIIQPAPVEPPPSEPESRGE